MKPDCKPSPSSGDETRPPSEEEIKLLFADLGVALHVYQRIELQLKLILPHLVVPGTDTHAPGEGFDNWRVLLDSKKTLAQLFQILRERVTPESTELFESMWRGIARERNEVVHHFAEQPFARLETIADYREAVLFLRSRRESALPLLRALDELSSAFFTAVQEQQRGEM